MEEIKYRLVRSKRKTLSASIKDGILEVRAPLNIGIDEIEDFIKKHHVWIERHLEKATEAAREEENEPGLSLEEIRALADEALKVIPGRVKYYAEQLGVTYGRITVRNQRSRWGSCTAKGNLNFNCLLMLAPTEVLDSVIVHELCHRKHMNHSASFYSEVLKVYPDYFKWDKWLKENGGNLIRRMMKG